VQVIPTINAPDLATAKKQVAIIKSFLLRGSWVQVDVSDSVFSSVKSWRNPAEFSDLKLGFYKTEVHLMVENPEDVVELWLREIASPSKRGRTASRIIVHLEAMKNSSHILDLCQKYGADLMLAINPETMVENLIPYWHNIKYFMILAVTPGRSGQRFQEVTWDKIRFLRERAPNVKIEIDGGVNPEVAARAKELGVDIVASGSYIINAVNPKAAYEQLCTPSTKEN